MPKITTIEIRPFGPIEIEIYPALIDNEVRVTAVIQDHPFLPIVSASAQDARKLAAALLDAADGGERAHRGIATPTATAEAQRSAGLRTQPKPGEPGYKEKA